MPSTADLTKSTLMKELRTLPIYRYHRHNLRPWDRKLPVLVAQEADHEEHWEIEPPSPLLIFGSLVLSLLIYQLLWLLPVYLNHDHIAAVWKNIAIPMLVYDEPKVWMSLWIVAHLCSGLTLWFVWLTGGWIKHVPELLPIAIAFFGECMWIDVAVYVGRLDLLVGLWVVISLCMMVSIVLLWRHKIAIGAIFLVPHFAACLSMIVYSAAFAHMHGKTYMWLGDIPRQPTPTPTS